MGGISTFRYTIDPNADLERPTIGASVASGTYETPVSVVFTVRDNRPAPVVAYFTTDGSAPTPASPATRRCSRPIWWRIVRGAPARQRTTGPQRRMFRN